MIRRLVRRRRRTIIEMLFSGYLRRITGNSFVIQGLIPHQGLMKRTRNGGHFFRLKTSGLTGIRHNQTRFHTSGLRLAHSHPHYLNRHFILRRPRRVTILHRNQRRQRRIEFAHTMIPRGRRPLVITKLIGLRIQRRYPRRPLPRLFESRMNARRQLDFH